MSEKRIECPTCQNGSLQARHESFPVRVSENSTLPSAPVSFLLCDSCGAAIFLGSASEEAHESAAIKHLEGILKGECALRGETLPHLRSVAGVSAKALSQALGLQSSAVSTWEKRNTKVSRPIAFMAAAMLYRKLCKDSQDFLEKLQANFLDAILISDQKNKIKKLKKIA
jgi:DNA-binding transcriptional regulator YiaG